MFMFRRKRTCLAKRLWKARIKQQRGQHEVRSKDQELVDDSEDDEGKECCAPCYKIRADEGLMRNSVLKRLENNQLEMLVKAVESEGAGSSTCVLVARDTIREPHLLCCQIWRWPNVQSVAELKRTPACSSASDPVYICCNPYHWSRFCEPESPPPPYSRFQNEKFNLKDCIPSEICDMIDYELTYNQIHPRRNHDAGANALYQQHEKFRGSLSTNGESDTKENEWCKLAYWELSRRVGRLYPVRNTSVNIFWTDIQADGLSLETLTHHSFSPPQSVYKNRNKIGLGITLSLEKDGVWIYNRSKWPVFVNSPSLDHPDCRTFLVYRVPAGHCFRVFSPAARHISSSYWNGSPIGPIDPYAVRISFAKGWGPNYHRQEIIACPTWLEILLSPCR